MAAAGQSESLLPEGSGGVEEAETVIMQPIQVPLADDPVEYQDEEPVDLFEDESVSRVFGEATARTSWFATHKACLLYTSPSPRD